MQLKKNKNKELYLKDDKALSEFLIENGIENFTFEGIGEKELIEILKKISQYRLILKELEKRYAMIDIVRFLIEKPAVRDVDFTQMFAEIEKFLPTIECNILNKTIAQEFLTLYVQTPTGLVETTIDQSLFVNNFFKEACDIYAKIQERDLVFLEGKNIIKVLEEIEESTKKSYDMQRYKGLGEMDPDQLQETTMIPSNRTLLRVTLPNEEEADRIFTLFMGDEVEPRREYIQLHAKDVKNLDV